MTAPHTLAWRFITRLVVISLVLAVVHAAAQWTWEYRNRTADLERSFHLVATSHLQSLESSLWTFDMPMAKLQLESLLKLPHVQRVTLDVTTGERWEMGQPSPDAAGLRRTYALVHEGIPLATLEVEASMAGVTAQLRRQAFAHLIGSVVVISLVALALTLLFRSLVARRLERLAAYATHLNPANLPMVPPPTLAGPPDELGALSDAFERLRLRLLAHEAQHHAVEAEIRGLNRVLSEARARAETASEAKSSFLRRMSHELRTPLNQILLYCDLVEEEVGERHPPAKEDLSRIRQAGQDLTAQLTDILDLVDLETMPCLCQRLPLHREALADQLRNLAEPWAQASGIGLRVDLSALPEGSLGDPERLVNALSKLLHNACRFTHQGEVSLTWDEARAAFKVSDTGPGIPPEHMDQLLDIFTQGDEGLSRAYGGLGLGLPICQHLARLMGGRLHGESEVGKGSTFYLQLGPQTPEA